jgi:Uma2 family endonuclease
MSVTVPKRKMATAADLLALPEEERFHEIIGGELVRKAMPSARHGGAQGRVLRSVAPYDRRPNPPRPGGWWIVTEVEVELDPNDVYRPDVTGWRRERLPALPDETPITVRPDWVCEVLSPSNRRNDTIKKRRVYHRCGVPHYWIVDPLEETLDVYRWHTDGHLQVLAAERGDVVKPEPFDDIELRVGVLFGEDEEDEG